MKITKITIVFLSIIILISYNSCTRPNCSSMPNECDSCASYYPFRDTFKVEDTLWFKIKVPKLYLTECGYYELKQDSIITTLAIGYSTNYDSICYAGNSIYNKNLVFKKGSRISMNSYYFVLENSKNYFVLDVGVILKDTGIVYFGDHRDYLSIHILDNVNPNYPRKTNWKLSGSVHTTFIENKKSTLSLYVKP